MLSNAQSSNDSKQAVWMLGINILLAEGSWNKSVETAKLTLNVSTLTQI